MRFLLLVAVIVLGLGSASAQQPGVAATPNLSPDLVEVMRERYARTIAVLRTDFPEDYATLIAELSGITWRRLRDDRESLLRGFEVMKSLRARYADRIVHAPSVSHSVMLGLLADFYDAVLAAEGPAVCGRFASDGSAVLIDLGLAERYAEKLDLQSVAYFDAVVKAIEAPENPDPVSPDDWEALFTAMAAAGVPRPYLDAIGSGSPTNPNLCPGLVTLFRASGLMDTPAAARIRADLAKNLAGY